MTWYEDRLPAMLGGIQLHYQKVDTDAGRRTVVHEFYGSQRQSYVEDIAPVTWRASIDVFVVGENYHLVRDDLVAVLNKPGPHEFIHPLRGSFQVRLGSPARLTESVSEGGMVRIGQLDLVEAGDSFPQIYVASSRKLVGMAFQTAEVMAATTRLDLTNANDKTRLGLLGALRAVTSALRKMNGRVTAQLNRIDSVSNAIQQFEASLEQLLNTPNALMSSLTGLALSVTSLIDKIPTGRTVTVEDPVFPVASTVEATVNDLGTFTTSTPEIVGVTGGTQKDIADAAHAEIQLQAQTAGFVAGAGVAGIVPFASATQAGSMLTLIGNGLAQSMAAPGLPPEAFQSLADLRATTIRHLIDRQAKLPRIVKITTPTTMPADVLAWEIYGDASRAAELVLRNRIAHPSYVPAGTVLEIVLDA